MSVRQLGRIVPVEASAVRAAHPTASGRLAVFLHGLTDTESAWCSKSKRHHGRPDVTYGTLLEEDLGLTSVFIRYNTGLHISDNGRQLGDLIDRLVDVWPVQVEDVVLIGHSMGGLVARSALHQASDGTDAARPWTRLVRDTITLGAPHLGAPLERGVHALTVTLARIPETRPLAKVLAARSVGIKDLRRGTLVEADWAGQDLDASTPVPYTPVPLHVGARHFVVLGTLTAKRATPAAHLFGDMLVPPLSASGDTGGDDRLAFLPEHIHHLGRLNHMAMLTHPRVYQQIRRWLETRPDGARPSVRE
jgi:pimeloyl-ACP methyl ester carboxylesterase